MGTRALVQRCVRIFPRQEKHLTVLEHLVAALNVFVRCVALNYRMRVCHLGEELMPALLCTWADMRPSVALQEAIVEFFSVQICVHHPKGARTQAAGDAGGLLSLDQRGGQTKARGPRVAPLTV